MAALSFAHIPNSREMGTWSPGRVCGPSSLMLHIPQLLRDTGHFPSSRQVAREGCISQCSKGVDAQKMSPQKENQGC